VGASPASGSAHDIHVFAATSNIVLVEQDMLTFLYYFNYVHIFSQSLNSGTIKFFCLLIKAKLTKIFKCGIRIAMTLFEKRTRIFTEVYSDYYPLVYSIVYSKVGNVDDAKDICQEVFIRLYNKFEDIKNPRKWLLVTLRYVVLEYYRKKDYKEMDIENILNDTLLTFVNGFRDTRILIEDAIEDMKNFKDEKEKILFDLIAIYKYTYKETGKYLGLTERQVRYKYSLIVKRLVQYFNRKGIKNLEDLL
jgi:RNA polymerase sigma factor (sigma-70 family)